MARGGQYQDSTIGSCAFDRMRIGQLRSFRADELLDSGFGEFIEVVDGKTVHLLHPSTASTTGQQKRFSWLSL